MKTKILVALFAAAALVSSTGCEEKKETDKKEDKKDDKKKDEKKDEKKDDKKTEEAKDSGGDMPAACKDYMKALDDCMEKSPASKTAMEPVKKAFQDAWDASKGTPEAAKAFEESGCKAPLAALKDNPACK